MQNKTVRQLKSLTKEFELKGYNQLRKAELIQMIEDHQRNSSSNILDEPVHEMNVPILGPVQFTAKNKVASLKRLAGNISKPILKYIIYITYIPEAVRNATSEKVQNSKRSENSRMMSNR